MSDIDRSGWPEGTEVVIAAPDPAIRSRELGLFGTFLRFPLPLACSVIIAVAAVLDAPVWGFRSEPLLLQIVLATAITWFFASVLFSLIAEARQWGRWAGIVLGLLSLPILLPFVVFETLIYESLPYPGIAMFGASMTLLSVLTPAWAHGAGPGAVAPFAVALLRRLLTSVPLALGLALPALALAIYAVIGSRGGELRLESAKELLCIVFPVWVGWVLAGLPRVGPGFAPPVERDGRPGYGWVGLGMFCIPSLYGLAAADLTTGWTVEWAAIGLAGFAALACWTGNSLSGRGLPSRDYYARYALPAISVPLCIMAVLSASDHRHAAITAGGYLVALLGLWTAGLSIICVVRPGRSRTTAASALAILLVAGSFGPWGLWQVTSRSRVAELERLLVGAGLVVDGQRAEPAAASIGDDVRREGERILRGLYDSGRGVAASDWIESIQPPRVQSDDPELAELDRYLDSLHRYPTWRAAMHGIGIEDAASPAVRTTEPAHSPRSGEDRIAIWVSERARDRAVQVSGYAIVTRISFPNGPNGEIGPELIVDRRGYRYRIDRITAGGIISVTTPDGHGATLDLVSSMRANPDETVMETRAGPLRVKFVLDNIEAERSPDGRDRMTSLAGLLAVGRGDGQ